jgi:hypothetical protein
MLAMGFTISFENVLFPLLRSNLLNITFYLNSAYSSIMDLRSFKFIPYLLPLHPKTLSLFLRFVIIALSSITSQRYSLVSLFGPLSGGII